MSQPGLSSSTVLGNSLIDRHLAAPMMRMVLDAGGQIMVFTQGPCSPEAGGNMSKNVRIQWRNCVAL